MRVTKAELKKLLTIVNEQVSANLALSEYLGKTRIVIILNKNAESDLCALGTKSETANFLRGMMAALELKG